LKVFVIAKPKISKCGRKDIFRVETTWNAKIKNIGICREGGKEREGEEEREESKERVPLAPGWPASHCYFEVQVDYSEYLYPGPASSHGLTNGRPW